MGTRVGLLHPGEMGSSIGAAARASVDCVLWASEGRSAASAERAARAELEDAGTLPELVARSDVILSVVPPHAALDVARAVAAHGFGGLYLDANAISPGRSRQVAAAVSAAGADYVDGGIIGGPAWREGTTRLCLSGPRAEEAAAVFHGGPLETPILDDRVGVASALKMVYAAWTKGTTALVAAILGVAQAEGVRDALMREWSISQQALAERAERRACGVTAKAWRFAGEMEEIAATFEAARLPGGFHAAAADVYRRLARFKDADTPGLAEVLAALLAGPA